MKQIIAALVCLGVFVAGFAISGNPLVFLNGTALLVVLSGTMGASLLACGLDRVKLAWRTARAAYRDDHAPISRVIAEFCLLSYKIRRDGPLGLEGVAGASDYMERAFRLASANYRPRELREVLEAEMAHQIMRRRQIERDIRNMAGYAPSFGVAGSVIGLVGLLAGIGETSLILKSIPIALVSTLYGVVLSNFLLLPVAEKIAYRTQQDILERRLVLSGTLGLVRGLNAYKLKTSLNALVGEEDKLSDDDLVELRRMAARKENEARAAGPDVAATRHAELKGRAKSAQATGKSERTEPQSGPPKIDEGGIRPPKIEPDPA
jgi:chemotaxis protein MotA